MAMSRFEKVKKYYELALWSEAQVRYAVVARWITKEEFKEIVGKEYEE